MTSLNVVEQASGRDFQIYNGDSCEIIKGIPDNSIHHIIYSPPFESLYTYSNSERDLGNCKNSEEFFHHFSFLAKDLYRILKPGRIMAFHCMDLPLSKQRDGVIGLRDFSGELIKLFTDVGFVLHCPRITIRKDPVTAMQRTKAIGLLYKQLKKDSCLSRMGIPDYLVVMRKPGENAEAVSHLPEDFPVSRWQLWAECVWHDIKPSNTLQRLNARDSDDERHICPLQLDVIERSLIMWSNPGDVIFTLFWVSVLRSIKPSK